MGMNAIKDPLIDYIVNINRGAAEEGEYYRRSVGTLLSSYLRTKGTCTVRFSLVRH